MTTQLTYLRLLFLSISGMLLFCLVFTVNMDLENETIAGQMYWFHRLMLLFAASVLFMELTIKKPNSIRFTVSDGLMLALAGLSFASYDWSFNPEPEKLLFGSQLVLLWFMLRLAIKNYQSLLMFYLAVILCTGIFEAGCGIRQLFHVAASPGSPLCLTGTFSHPDLFGGYLTCILPLGFGIVLRFHDCKKTAFCDARTTLYYISLLSVLLILVVLVAGMCHPAWVAAVVSCTWVYLCYRNVWRYIGRLWKGDRVKFVGGAACGLLLLVGGILVAGFPEHALREYLRIGAERGVLAFLVFVVWLGYSVYYATKSQRHGLAGGIMSFIIMALSVHPLQRPSLWVLLVFFSVISVSTNKVRESQRREPARRFPYLGLLLTACCLFLFWAHTG